VKSAIIRVLVVSDIRLYRDGLAQVFADERRLAVVGAAADAPTAARLAANTAPTSRSGHGDATDGAAVRRYLRDCTSRQGGRARYSRKTNRI